MLVDRLSMVLPRGNKEPSGGGEGGSGGGEGGDGGEEKKPAEGVNMQENPSSSMFRRPRRPGQDGASSWIIKKNNL